jgi:glucose-6-phosphate isomerase
MFAPLWTNCSLRPARLCAVQPISQTPQWQNLVEHHAALGNQSLRSLFANDPKRADRFTVVAGDLIADLSKHRWTDDTRALLNALAQHSDVAGRFGAMVAGERINITEDRAVLHTALRRPVTDSLVIDGVDVVAAVHDVLASMGTFAESVRSGAWRGATGSAIRAIVNIGIGGSDLGPSMATLALKAFGDPSIVCRFVANVDPADLAMKTADLDPATTLVIVASKTFTTLETMANARAARRWITSALGDDAVAKHMVAVSTNAQAVGEFGIDTANMFGFWDWVGGRYSMDGAIGLSIMCAIGSEAFGELLGGFHTMDVHMATTALADNLPVQMALVGVWNRNFEGCSAKAVIPYAQPMEHFSDYLQQLDMESNGKCVRLDGSSVDIDTGPLVWGTLGTNGQHAYFQLLHQGTAVVPIDFIGFAEPADQHRWVSEGDLDQHELLLANLLAQAEALAFGKTAEEVATDGVRSDLVPHRTFPGGRPSTVILAQSLTPAVLGQLIALYEHIVFVQGTIWQINSYDQWGVELGKVLAMRIAPELAGAVEPGAHDSSTLALIARLRAMRSGE